MYTTSDMGVLDPLLKKANYYALPLKGIHGTFHPEWLVDDLENPKGLFYAPHYFGFLYSEDDTYLKALCEERFTDGFYGFAGVHPAVFDHFKSRFFIQWLTVSSQFHYTGDRELFEEQYVVEAVRPDWAEEINALYEYKNDNTLAEIRRAIDTRPSACIRLDGEMASWVLLHDDYSIGFMFTKPEYRKLGLGKLVSRHIVNACVEKGITPFLQIVHGNQKSEGLAMKSGFVKHADVYWFGIIVPGPESVSEIREEYSKRFATEQPIQFISSYGFSQFKDLGSEYTVEMGDGVLLVSKEGVPLCEVACRQDDETYFLKNETDYIDWGELLKAIRATDNRPYVAVMFSGSQVIEGVQSLMIHGQEWSLNL